eukprot:2173156-Alexandrium_andersonii.AAC.1
MVHVRRFAPACRWLVAFLEHQHGPLVRTFTVGFHRTPVLWTVTTDASPWGMGAVLSGPLGPVEYFGIPLDRADLV